MRDSAFATALLLALGAAPAAAIEGLDASASASAELMQFGRFVGDWDLVIENRQDDGRWNTVEGEWHFGWVLEGRAVQDVWIAYKPGLPRADPDAKLGYGTTIRVYNPQTRAWHVNWIGVLNHSYTTFLARAAGNEIVMDARDDDGHPMQWIFYDIGPESFRWRAQDSRDGGKTWSVVQRMTATRRPPR